MEERKYKLSASLICANPLIIGEEIRDLADGGIDYLHFDVMDGNFVPRYGLHPELLKAIRSLTDLPIDVHMMSGEPIRYIPAFARAGASVIAVHAEACKHLHRTLSVIHENGAKAGVVLNYATPLNVLDYIMDDIDMVELMAINPGIVGHKLIPGTIKKIIDLKKKIDESGRDVIIAIDGGVNPDSAPLMIKAGADLLVCGTSAIFRLNEKLGKGIKDFREVIDNGLAHR
jgi:ribulose-phosphate 3-epimerase